MTDSPKPIWQELFVPSEEERRMFERWVEQQKKEDELRENKEKERVIVIDI